ncbi:MAG TPA: PKD domain-containing protein [Bacteroidales bacterium]|nr:PKD domain-containing protein [Bacteroidales bacterium]
MKKSILLIAITTLVLAGCEMRPDASFYSSSSTLELGEPVHFTNTSINAVDFEWDFGDGTFSTNRDVSHAFTEPGSYTITLTAYSSDNRLDRAYKTIHVLEPIQLQIYSSHNSAETDELVSFSPNNFYADYFVWDFGDGNISYNDEPVHSWTKPGNYLVTLTAYINDRVADKSYFSIDILPPTRLVITVLEYFDRYPVADASVILYPSLTDWNNETNMLGEGFTDQNGDVTFTYLYQSSFYVDVWHENYNNYSLAEEDIDFIATPVLEPNKINYFVAYVDYIPSSSLKSGTSRQMAKKMRIRKFERVYPDKTRSLTEPNKK